MTIHDVIQGDQEWYELRLGRIGSSEAACLLVDGKSKSGLGTGAITLLFKKANEILTGEIESGYTSDDMEEGKENEPIARRRYEDSRFTKVQTVGYVSNGDYIGYSPDGFVADDGLIEIKCPGGPAFIRYAITKELKKPYYAQMQWGMWLTGRKWCDFVVYNPDFENDLIVTRIFPDPEIHEKFEAITKAFIVSLEKTISRMRVKAPA